MMKNIQITLLWITTLLFISCSNTSQPTPPIKLDLNQTMLSKIYSLEEYKALPKAKRFKGEFSIGDKEINELASKRPFQKEEYMLERTYKSDKVLNHVTELLKDKTFQKAYPNIFSKDLDILVHSKHKMFVICSGRSETSTTINIWMNMQLFEINGKILKAYFLDGAGGEIVKPVKE